MILENAEAVNDLKGVDLDLLTWDPDLSKALAYIRANREMIGDYIRAIIAVQ